MSSWGGYFEGGYNEYENDDWGNETSFERQIIIAYLYS